MTDRRGTSTRSRLASIRHLLGVPEHTVSLRDRALATVVAALGIGVVIGVAAVVGGSSYVLLGSIGASAVLVFAVPHGPLSQPWAVIGGQVGSAVAGVATARLLGGGPVAAAVAVAAAVGVMHALRCIHPPGGATALAAVLTVRATGAVSWTYVASPVLLDAVALVLAGVVLNAPFAWRRYPVGWVVRPHDRSSGGDRSREAPFTVAQLGAAVAELDTVVDVSDEELQALYTSLHRRHELDHLDPAGLRVDGCYSNGRDDDAWSVRRVLRIATPVRGGRLLVVRTEAGPERGAVQTMSDVELAAWGRYEVVAGDTSWVRPA